MTEVQGHIAAGIIDGLLWTVVIFILYRIIKEEYIAAINSRWYPNRVRDKQATRRRAS